MGRAATKVLLVEDNLGDARLTTENLEHTARGGFQVVWQPTLAAAVSRLAKEPFDVILLDVDLPDSWGLHGLEVLRTKAPGLPVILFTGLSDDELGRRAIEAGAHGFLSKWQNQNETLPGVIQTAIRHAEEAPHAAEAKGSIIGVAGVKGGVGTTTLVLNLAGVLAKRGRRVSALELESGPGGFRHHVRQTPTADWSQLAGVPHTTIDDKVLGRALTRSPFEFDLLFSPSILHEARPLTATHARVITARLAGPGATALFDLGRLCSDCLRFAQLCDRMLIVTDRDAVSVACADAAVRAVEISGVARTGLVVVDRTPVVRGPSPEEIASAVGAELTGYIPYALETLNAAHAGGSLLALKDPDCRFAAAIEELAGVLAPSAETAVAEPVSVV